MTELTPVMTMAKQGISTVGEVIGISRTFFLAYLVSQYHGYRYIRGQISHGSSNQLGLIVNATQPPGGASRY